MIERKLAFLLYSMENTLKASRSHWKVSRPKDLDNKTYLGIFDAIRTFF